jgi:peptidoglycan/xylan/chitin deacetylase (PgdA/CDA1 family)
MTNTVEATDTVGEQTCEQKSDQGALGHSRNYMRFRKLVRWAVASATYGSGVTRLYAKRSRARILVYHSIDHDPLNPFSVSPLAFEAQVRRLAEAYHPISLDELVSHIREGTELPANAVAITLDDGLRDNYRFAYPILNKYGVPATIYVVVDKLKLEAGTDSASDGGESERYLLWPQVKEMSENGISIGSHTLTHPWLTEVPLEQARHEIAASKTKLEQFLDKPVRHFAYPGGRLCDYNQEIKEAVIESGYLSACVGLNGTNGLDTDPYLLRRTKIEVDDSMAVFERALKGGLDAFVLLDKTRG